jgi:phosphatidylserine decarboxylase
MSIVFFGTMFLLLSIAFLVLTPLWLGIATATVCLILWFCIISFFRIPRRTIPAFMPDDIVSPADGKICNINTVFEKEFFKDERLLISVFMSPANVHVNRFSVGGTVKYVRYHPGRYLVAFHEKSSELNERNTVVVSTEQHDILIRQIAGAVARRIACYVQPNMSVQRGDELGFIRFGSRVDVYLPLTATVKVQLGQKVKGGIDVLAQL